MNFLFILLGCHIFNLLDDRITSALQYAGKFNETNIDWFLSGGIKNPNEDTISEAVKMANEIKKYETIHTINQRGNKWDYIYDNIATNTAENFIMVNNYLNKINKQYDNVYIITSRFHYNRANKIANKILNIDTNWILGEAKLHDSEYWEKLHIKNVDNDINKALNKYK